MILLIDNYDSFTYNLYQFIGIFESNIKVYRNDEITIESICTDATGSAEFYLKENAPE